MATMKNTTNQSIVIIKSLIKEKYGTQKNFCQQTKYSESSLSRYLKGERELNPTVIVTLEKLLQVAPGTILNPGSAARIQVPEYSIKLSAGNGCNVFEEKPLKYCHFDASELKEGGWKQDRICVFKVSGDSMQPKIDDDQGVLVNTDEVTITDNKYYAFCVNDEVFIKTLFKDIISKKIIIHSENPAYADKYVTEDQIKIIGRVVLLLARKV